MSKKEFWIRFAIWLVFVLIVPVLFIMFKFDIFTPKEKTTFGGWGLIIVIITAIVCIVMLRYITKSIKHTMLKQVISGLSLITLPLGALLIGVYLIRNSLDAFLITMLVVLVCETIAIPINPFPKWVQANKVDELETAIDIIERKRGK